VDTPQTLEARLSLFGFVSTPVVLAVTPRTRGQRVGRAIASAIGGIVLAPIVFLIPPHAEWVMLSVATGLYWARKNWIAEFVVATFDGRCPRCYAPVKVKPGATLRFPHAVTCYSCHQHPVLEEGTAPPVDETRRDESVPPPRHSERRLLKIWSPAGSDW
jgi:hypothetical protein